MPTARPAAPKKTKKAAEPTASSTAASTPLSIQDYLRKILTSHVYDVAIETPLDEARSLSRRLGHRVLFKREDKQPVFSFKLRGAYNKMAGLSRAQLAKGVICASAGNHAQGVAISARRRGIPALVVMPRTTPQIKVQAVRDLDAVCAPLIEMAREKSAHVVVLSEYGIERAERAVGARVRVAADHDRPGHDEAVLDHDLVLDAATALVVEMDAVLQRPLLQPLLQPCR